MDSELLELRGKLSDALMNIHDQFQSIYKELAELREKVKRLENKQSPRLTYPRRRSYL